MSWTAERIEQARQLWLEGKSGTEIAEAIGGVSRNAILGIAHRQGWPSRGSENRKANHARSMALNARKKATFKRPPGQEQPGKDGGLGFRLKRLVANPPKVAPPPIAEPRGDRARRLVDLKASHCRWPVGEDTGVNQLFCGAGRAGEDTSYCPWHRQKARGTGTPSERAAVREAERIA